MKLNFAENLRSLRRGKDLTQEQLADLLAVSVQTVSRWENELTYPDVELLPAIAELFETSVDALLGVTEALKEQQISVFWEKLNRTESSRERTGILREAHRAFPRDLTFSARLCSSILYSDDPVSNPAALHEMRTLAEDVLANASDSYLREEVIASLVCAEDEERTELLLSKHSSGITRTGLLRQRYAYRRETAKERYITQRNTAEALSDQLLNDLNNPSDDPDEKIAAYRTSIAVIDTLIGCVNPNPVSGDGIPDMWSKTRIHLGNRMAAWYAKKSDRDAVYEILEDNVALFEKVLALPKGALLTYRTPGLSSLVYRTAHSFDMQPNCDADYGKRLYKTLHFIPEPENPPFTAYYEAFFPTTYTWALTDRECWNEFDFMRDEPRFQTLAKRMTDAIEWKKSE